MRLLNLTEITNGISNDILSHMGIDENDKPLPKDAFFKQIFLMEAEYLKSSILAGGSDDAYYLFADGVELYLTTVFSGVKDADIYRRKANKIINEMKSGSVYMNRVEDLVKIFISFMRCCSGVLLKGQNTHYRVLPVDTPFELSIREDDLELLNAFSNYTFMMETSEKILMVKRNKLQILDDDQQQFLMIVLMLYYLRIASYEGMFVGKEIIHG